MHSLILPVKVSRFEIGLELGAALLFVPCLVVGGWQQTVPFVFLSSLALIGFIRFLWLAWQIGFKKGRFAWQQLYWQNGQPMIIFLDHDQQKHAFRLLPSTQVHPYAIVLRFTAKNQFLSRSVWLTPKQLGDANFRHLARCLRYFDWQT